METSPWLLGRRRKDSRRVQPLTLGMSQVESRLSPALSLGRRSHRRPLMLGECASHPARRLPTKTELWSHLDPGFREKDVPSPGERPRQGKGPSPQARGSRKSLLRGVQLQHHLPAPLTQPVPHTTQCLVGQAGGPATWPTSLAHWPRTAKTQTRRGPSK